MTTASGIITTAAGICTEVGFSGDGGPATGALMSGPASVAVDDVGNLYISDFYNDRIRKVTASTGIITTVAGNGTSGSSGDGGPATNAEWYDPFGIAVDAAGNIYIADAVNNSIRKVPASTGVIATVAGTLSAWGGYSGDGGPATNAELDEPEAVAADGSDNIFFLDQTGAVVRKVNKATGIISTVAGINTWAFSGDGDPATNTQFNEAERIAVDRFGNFYVAYTFNNRIRKVTVATSIVTTIAGDGVGGFSGDGDPATEAEFSIPSGVAVDHSGKVYIGDTGNNRIRLVFPGGLAGSATYVSLPFAPLVGATVDLKATVSGRVNLPAPTGTVRFYDGTVALGTGALDSKSTATFPIDTLSAGTRSISAAYGATRI